MVEMSSPSVTRAESISAAEAATRAGGGRSAPSASKRAIIACTEVRRGLGPAKAGVMRIARYGEMQGWAGGAY